MLCHVYLFFKLCSWYFQQPSGDSGTWATGSSGLAEFSVKIYIGERELTCFAHFVSPHHPRSHFTKLLTRAIFFGPGHGSYIFVPSLAFRVHVAE